MTADGITKLESETVEYVYSGGADTPDASKARLKIAVIFKDVPQAGGAFHQSINAIEQFKRVSGETLEVHLFHSGKGEDVWLGEIGQKSTLLRETWRSRTIEGFLRFLPRSLSRRLRIISPREKFLLSLGIDLIYFTSPNTLAVFLRKLRYILTFYDICHRDFPEFPEIADFSNFESCESYNWTALPKAVAVLVDSEELKSRVCQTYALQPERVLVMPYGVSRYISRRHSNGALVSEKYHLRRPFLFYPAQFWAHKNHVRILQALQILEHRGQPVDVAFAGSDKGGRAYLEAAAVRLGVSDRVHFLGFVPSEDLAGLYSESLALVMPTYFGPTNIPPLEAWSLDVPVIYSKHLSRGLEDAVLAIDVDSPDSIAGAIEQVTREAVRQALIAGGRRALERTRRQLAESEKSFQELLLRFARRRQTWGWSQLDTNGCQDEKSGC
jgi:glycosyltransferase involved in cell wall biosynthesis